MTCRILLQIGAAGAVIAGAVAAGPASAGSVEDFYKQHNITMVVGSGAGGGYDTYARTFARDYKRFVPGKPDIIVKNMPGAGGLKAANYEYNVAPKDGTEIQASFNTVMMEPLYGEEKAKFDPRKFTWIGSIGKQTGVCLTWKGTGIKSLQDAREHTVLAGATSGNATPTIFPAILNKYFGTKFKVVAGYTTSGLRLAFEKGEFESLCGMAYETHMPVTPSWFLDHKVNIILQLGLEKSPYLPKVPLAISMLDDPHSKKVFRLLVIPEEFGRPIIAPPNVPADRAKALQKAFKDTMQDEAFLAHAKKVKLFVEPIYADKIEALLNDAYDSSKDVIAAAAVFAARPKNKK